VTKDRSVSEQIVFTVDYQAMISELAKVGRIEIESGYSEVIANLDSAKVVRSKLEAHEILNFLTENSAEIMRYSVSKFAVLSNEEDEEEYPLGLEPGQDEKAKVVSAGKYSQGFLLTNLIEYLLARKGREQLLGYLRTSRVPKAKQYADQIIHLMCAKS